MMIAPEKIGTDARRRLERAFRVSVGVLTVAGIALPMAFAQADIVNYLFNLMLFGVVKLFEAIINFVGQFAILLVDAIIRVAQYNEFTKAKPVEAGWPLVRDVMNMFFIVVLLITAFSTIIQYKKFQYKQILPKLLLMAVLVNFSKTLIGLMIDFSQVVMLTFVNGFKAAATGNFVTVLRLDKVLKWASNPDTFFGASQEALNSRNTDINSSTPLKDSMLIKILLAEMLGLFMLGTTVVTLLVMLIYLIGRIVGLWIALIMSPAAFFATALANTPLSGKLSLVTGNFWDRLGAMLSGGPIMAFFLWLTLATVQTGGFDNLAASETRTSEQSGAVIQYFSTAVGNAQELAYFLVGIMMLLMGLEAAVSISKQVSAGLGSVTGRVRDSGMRLTRFASYGAAVAGGAVAARGVGRGVQAGGRLAESRLDLSGRLGRGLQNVGSRLPIVGSAVARGGAGLTARRTEQRKTFTKELEGATANLSAEDKIRALEEFKTNTLNKDKQMAATAMLAKLEATGDGMKAVNKKYAKEAEENHMVGPEAKAFAESQTRQHVAKRLTDLEKLAQTTNDEELLKYVREEREKRPDLNLTQDPEKDPHGDERIGGIVKKMMDDGDADDFAKKLKSEVYQDTRATDTIIKNGMLNEDGTVNEESVWYKSVVEKGGMRGQIFKQRIQDLKEAAGPTGNVAAVLASGTMAGFYAKSGEGFSLVNRETLVAARKPEGVPAAYRPREGNKSNIKKVKNRLDEIRKEPTPDAGKIRAAQNDLMREGARLPQIYKMNDSGTRFDNDEERGHFRHNVQTALQTGGTDAATYRQLDVGYMGANERGENQARTTFSAMADTDQMKTALQNAQPDTDDHKAVAKAIQVVHDEGVRVEKVIERHNTKNPQQPVNITAVATAGEANNPQALNQAIAPMAQKISVEEARAVAQKRKIDADPDLQPFRRHAGTHAAQAVANAGGAAAVPAFNANLPAQQPPAPGFNNPPPGGPGGGGNQPPTP